jgi:glycosyltransferase involved in cell wall biosynthesis
VKKICYVLSYKDPKYIRTRVLLRTLRKNHKFTVVTAINETTGIFRYADTILRLIFIRLKHRPDIYLLGFRGHEILWLVRAITAGKPLIFDEFININAWLDEHTKQENHSFLKSLIKKYMKYGMAKCQLILTDTKLHARLSSEYYKLNENLFAHVYVGTDEQTFYKTQVAQRKKININVLFYGSFLPLHGIKYILEAAKLLNDNNHIKFTLVGGSNDDEQNIRDYVEENNLSNIYYRRWVEYDKLPNLIEEADICLGGPFGDTPQSNRVITGKTFQFLAAAKPILIGYIDENVGFLDKTNCLLVKQGSSKNIATQIIWAYENKDKLAKIGKRGQNLYKSKFSNQNIANRLSLLISKIY